MKVLIVYAHPRSKSFCHAILQNFSRGLEEAGHEYEVIDLYAIRFDPVFREADYASYVHSSIPDEVLEKMDLKKYVQESIHNPIVKFILSRWLQGKTDQSVAQFIHEHRPKDVVAQWEKIKQAQAMVFIAPIFWLGFPAILKGWFERVFSYGDAYALNVEGWNGHASGRIPLLQHEKALVISTTLFCEEDYKSAWQEPVTKIVDDWGLRYPGVKKVEHVYFYGVPIVDENTRRGYLEQAYQLGKEFFQPEGCR